MLLEIFNGYDCYPPEVYFLPYCSDIALLADFTGLAIIEAAITRTPCFLPYELGDFTNELMSKDSTNPMFKDFFNRGLVTNKISDEYFINFKLEIENFINDWYEGDIDSFWEKTLKYIRS